MSKTLYNVQKTDFKSIPFKGVNKRTSEGYLTGEAPIAQVGILRYKVGDTIRRELVTADALFDAQSMDTLQLKPFTNTHPPEELLDSTSVKNRKIGFTGEKIKRQDELLITSYIVSDKDAIDSIEAGRNQLSPGYVCDLLIEPGEFNGERYDAVQFNRRYNHVALCDLARGGSNLKIDLVKCDGFEYIEEDNLKFKKENLMPEIKLDGIAYEAAPEVINAYTKSKELIKSLNQKLDSSTKEVNVLKANLDSSQDKLKVLEESFPQKLSEAVKSRLKLERSATIVLGDVDKMDSMTDRELQEKMILKIFPKAKLEGENDVYIRARLDSALEGMELSKEEKTSSVFPEIVPPQAKTVEVSRTDMISDLEKGWLKDLKA